MFSPIAGPEFVSLFSSFQRPERPQAGPPRNLQRLFQPLSQAWPTGTLLPAKSLGLVNPIRFSRSGGQRGSHREIPVFEYHTWVQREEGEGRRTLNATRLNFELPAHPEPQHSLQWQKARFWREKAASPPREHWALRTPSRTRKAKKLQGESFRFSKMKWIHL